jgi:hypothetical protein
MPAGAIHNRHTENYTFTNEGNYPERLVDAGSELQLWLALFHAETEEELKKKN